MPYGADPAAEVVAASPLGSDQVCMQIDPFSEPSCKKLRSSSHPDPEVLASALQAGEVTCSDLVALFDSLTQKVASREEAVRGSSFAAGSYVHGSGRVTLKYPLFFRAGARCSDLVWAGDLSRQIGPKLLVCTDKLRQLHGAKLWRH